MARRKDLVEHYHIFSFFTGLQLIGLRPDNLQGNAMFRQPLIGLPVDIQSGMAQVDEQAQHDQVRRLGDVFADKVAPHLPLLAASPGKAVSRQVDEEKGRAANRFAVFFPQLDAEVVDGLRFSRFAADPGQAAVVAQRVDEARLPYVGTA